MEFDLPILFGLHVHTAQLYIEPPQPPFPPPYLGSYTRALLVSQDWRHHFVTTMVITQLLQYWCSTPTGERCDFGFDPLWNLKILIASSQRGVYFHSPSVPLHYLHPLVLFLDNLTFISHYSSAFHPLSIPFYALIFPHLSFPFVLPLSSPFVLPFSSPLNSLSLPLGPPSFFPRSFHV